MPTNFYTPQFPGSVPSGMYPVPRLGGVAGQGTLNMNPSGQTNTPFLQGSSGVGGSSLSGAGGGPLGSVFNSYLAQLGKGRPLGGSQTTGYVPPASAQPPPGPASVTTPPAISTAQRPTITMPAPVKPGTMTPLPKPADDGTGTTAPVPPQTPPTVTPPAIDPSLLNQMRQRRGSGGVVGPKPWRYTYAY